MSHSPLPAFAAVAGELHSPSMVLVGEAWGNSEAQYKTPFVGASGQELFKLLGEAAERVNPSLHAEALAATRGKWTDWIELRDAWLREAGIAYTNTFALQPAGNKIEALCAKKAEVGGDEYKLPPLSQGKYFLPEFLPEIERLRIEITHWRPNLVVCLGNVASWALLGRTNIGSIRGAITSTVGAFGSLKALPTFHPAGMMRNWSWRPVMLADFIKAFREGKFPEVRRPARAILVDPTEEEILVWVDQTMAYRPARLACDTETRHGTITMISFASSRDRAICIPFVREGERENYWPDQATEERIWMQVERLLDSGIELVFQNGVYDFQYTSRMALRTRLGQDPMLLHHALFPEMQKGLGFLGSVYANEPAWKLMRTAKADTEKRDE